MTNHAAASTTVPIVAVVGPTATGKSDLAVDIALTLDGEVVNADSMQIYRGMDIGTAKLPIGQRRGVPHHLLDVLGVREPATVADFQAWARDAIADCRDRQIVPVVVGGSALYVRAVLDVLAFPGTDPQLRERLESELALIGANAMHARLRAVDPPAAQAILPGNGRRIVRALEVNELTGRPFKASLPSRQYAPAGPVIQIGLDISRDLLDTRITERVDRDVGGGLRRRGTAARAGWAEFRSHRLTCARLPPGSRASVRSHRRSRGSRRHRVAHASVRPPTACLVPARPPDRLAAA